MDGNTLKEVKVRVDENEWLVVRRWLLEEVEIALCVLLLVDVDLYLLQKWVGKDVNRNRKMLREDTDENVEHVFTKFKVGITFDEDESHGLVDDWCEPIP